MDRQILDLYEWDDGVCFRHPAKGVQPTAVVKTLHPRAGSDRAIRACAECVLDLEAERECVARAEGCDYRPGPLRAEVSPNSDNETS